MNILIITPTLSGGGAERTAANLATILNTKYNVTLVVIDGRNSTYTTSSRIIDLKMKIDDKRLKSFWYFKLWKEVNAIKKKLNISTSISFLNDADLVNVSTQIFKCNNIISIRNKISESNNSKLDKIKHKYSLSFATSIVAISQLVKIDLQNNFNVAKEKIKVIYNPSNSSLINSKVNNDIDEIDKSIFNSGIVIVNIGRLVRQKGQKYLINSFARVVNHFPEAKLIILGEGPLRKELEKLIEKLSLQNSVYLLGYKSNPYPYLFKSKVFVFSSLFEGLGNSIVESLVCQVPVISTDCEAGPREILSPTTNPLNTRTSEKVDYAEYGVLIPPFTEEGDNFEREKMLSDAIIELLQNKDLYENYRVKSLDRIEKFDDNTIFSEWEELLK